jgi:hypothetical protein
MTEIVVHAMYFNASLQRPLLAASPHRRCSHRATHRTPQLPYRHFPTRDVLLEAVDSTEAEKLAAAELEFAQRMPLAQALLTWMLLFIDYIATKQILRPGAQYARRRTVEGV